MFVDRELRKKFEDIQREREATEQKDAALIQIERIRNDLCRFPSQIERSGVLAFRRALNHEILIFAANGVKYIFKSTKQSWLASEGLAYGLDCLKRCFGNFVNVQAQLSSPLSVDSIISDFSENISRTHDNALKALNAEMSGQTKPDVLRSRSLNCLCRSDFYSESQSNRFFLLDEGRGKFDLDFRKIILFFLETNL